MSSFARAFIEKVAGDPKEPPSNQSGNHSSYALMMRETPNPTGGFYRAHGSVTSGGWSGNHRCQKEVQKSRPPVSEGDDFRLSRSLAAFYIKRGYRRAEAEFKTWQLMSAYSRDRVSLLL